MEKTNLSDLIQFQDNYLRLKYIRENRKDIVPFIGAGISKGCGLYLWGELLDALAEGYLSQTEIRYFRENCDLFKYADKIVQTMGNTHLAMKRIRELFEKREVTISKSVYILLNSFSPLLVTTNYDDIFEKAAAKIMGYGSLKPLLPVLKGQVDEAIQINERCLLKLHGSLEETTSFILTTEQYDKFYGKSGTLSNRPLPLYLERIFSGKKVLFVGCSLEEDRPLEILERCIQKYMNISHYAVVPWDPNEEKRILRARKLMRLGIEPIYYPEGDYRAQESLLCYMAESLDFLNVISEMIIEKIPVITSQKKFADTLNAVLRQSYYDTSAIYPEILDNGYAVSAKTLVELVKKRLSENKDTDTVFRLLVDLFDIFIDNGFFRDKEKIKKAFEQYFSDSIIRETIVEDVLKREWSLNSVFGKCDRAEGIGLKRLTKLEYTQYARDLINKLHYENGMSYADILPVLNGAQNLVNQAGNQLDFTIEVRLLNAIGITLMQFKDLDGAESYLKMAIQKMDTQSSQDRNDQLFLAKVYNNLAIVLAYKGNDQEAVVAIKKDIQLKYEYDEESSLVARSLNLYATLMKEHQPFEAGNIYLKSAQIKEEYIFNSYIYKNKNEREVIASWATTIFNIGLLLRDVELYEDALLYIRWANEARWKTVDPCNKDYCSSLNVQAEIEIVLNKEEQATNLIKIINSKENLPEGFSKLLGHSWYVCALYYMVKEEYITAYKYVNKSLSSMESDVKDIKQIFRSKMLLGTILQKEPTLRSYVEEPEQIYEKVLADAICLYGKDNYFLCKIYRFLMKNAADNKKRQEYEEKYTLLYNRYTNSKKDLLRKVKDYWRRSPLQSLQF